MLLVRTHGMILEGFFAANSIDCSQSPIFPFDRRDRAQTFTILVLKSERELGRAI